MADYKPTVLVDFDGVLHTYSRGWADGTVYDPPMPGAAEALDAMEADGYEVWIFSTRDWQQIADAFDRWGWKQRPITNVKRAAVCMIDDRAIRFTAWPQALGALRANYPIRTEAPAYRPERTSPPPNLR